jgi:two-component system, LytTR family, sensor kinase
MATLPLKPIQTRIIWLGILFSIMIPAVGILSRNGPRILTEQIPVIWAILSFFLFLIWALNYVLYVYVLYRYRVRFYVGVLTIAASDTALVLFFFMLVRFGIFPFSSAQYSIGDYSLLIRFGFAITLVAVIQYMFISQDQQERLRRKNEKLRYENLAAELESLKEQINPHFLFNSLGTLRAMIHENDENAEQYLLRLSTVYRQYLTKRNHPTNTLSEELAFLDSYLYMLRFRYEDTFTLTTDLSECLGSRRLPVFCLQLLVENCIKHNVLSARRPLWVRIYEKEPGKLTVENNRQPKRTETDSLGIGLDNLRRRFRLLGVANAVTIEETETLYSVSVTLLAP